MVFGGVSQLGLLEVALFLIPGLVGIKILLRITNQSDRFNQLDTIGISFGLSLVSMGILYVFFSYQQNGREGYLPAEFLQTTELESLLNSGDIHIISGLYLLVIAICILLGTVFGAISRCRKSPLWAENRIWENYFNKVEDDEFQLRVVTSNGTKIEGRIDKYGESAGKRDITLRKPRTVSITNDGEVETIEKWTGAVYIHNQDISYVKIDELPDAEEVLEDDKEDEDGEEIQYDEDGPSEEDIENDRKEVASLMVEESAEDGFLSRFLWKLHPSGWFSSKAQPDNPSAETETDAEADEDTRSDGSKGSKTNPNEGPPQTKN